MIKCGLLSKTEHRMKGGHCTMRAERKIRPQTPQRTPSPPQIIRASKPPMVKQATTVNRSGQPRARSSPASLLIGVSRVNDRSRRVLDLKITKPLAQGNKATQKVSETHTAAVQIYAAG